jgi:hypothetical protein
MNQAGNHVDGRMREPCTKQANLVAMRAAAVHLWGETGLREIGQLLPDDARRDTVEAHIIGGSWVPERYAVAWYEAVWRGPAREQHASFVRFVETILDLGFGRVRRIML